MDNRNSIVNNSQSFFSSKHKQVMMRTLPYIPSQVNLKRLHPNGKLLTDNEIRHLEALHLEQGRHAKADLKISYNIIKLDEELFAIYNGEEKILGKGAFGTVKIVQHLDTRQYFALKNQLINDNDNTLKEAQAEQAVLKEFNQSPKTPLSERKSHSKGKMQYSILMDLAEGMPLSALNRHEKQYGLYETYLTQPMISSLVRLQLSIEIIKAVKAFVENRFVHRDIRPDNIVVNLTNLSVKIVDYGSVRKLNEENEYITHQPSGNPVYYAPELRKALLNYFKGENARFIFNKKTEIYALALVLADFYGVFDYINLPEASKNPLEKVGQLGDKNYIVDLNAKDPVGEEYNPKDLFRFNDTVPEQQLKKILDILHQMTSDEAKRYSFDQAISAFEKVKEELKATLKVAMLDVNDYARSDPNEKDGLIKTLRAFDQVRLIDSGGKEQGDFAYVQMKRQLEIELDRPIQKVIESKNKEIEEANKKVIDEEEKGVLIIPKNRELVGDTVFIGQDRLAIQHTVKKYVADLCRDKKLSVSCEVVNSKKNVIPEVRRSGGKPI